MSNTLVVEVFDCVCEMTTSTFFSINATTQKRVIKFLHDEMVCMAYEHGVGGAGYSDEVLGRLENIPWNGLDFAFNVLDLPMEACGKVEKLM